MKLWIEIQRAAGIDRRDIKPGNDVGIADGACPGCGTEPFIVLGHGSEHVRRGLLRAAGTSKCCGDPVGYIYAQESDDTIFGAEEDRALISFGRARVYGGGLRL